MARIFDKIDTMFSRHLDFAPEQLDYIVNSGIKYRLGQADESDDD